MIRLAEPADVPVLLQLVRELAEYEREPDAVRVTPEDLRAQLACARPPFECVVAEWDGAPAGMALFFQNYSTWRGRPGVYLEDLFVRPEFRRRGIGRALLAHLARLARERGCARLEWAVLDWNAPAIAFYRALGAVALDTWTVFRLTDEALDRLARSAEN